MPQSPLRVLLVSAGPSDAVALSLHEEGSKIEKAIGQIGYVETRRLEHATRRDLRCCLRVQDFQIVHFMGHGEFDETAGEGSLILEDANGFTDAVSGEALAILVNGSVRPLLVVLNACESGKSTDQMEADAFAGVAASLVREGVPMVLAMRQSVDDGAAVEFAEEFYRALAAGDAVEAALVEARVAVHTLAPHSPEWATPILFSRPVDPVQESLANPDILDDPGASGEEGDGATHLSPAGPEFQQSTRARRIGTVNNFQAKSMTFGVESKPR